MSAGRLYDMARHFDTPLDNFFEGLELPVASRPTPDLLFRNDKQVIALVKSFVQISNADTRSAVASLASSIAKGERPQAKPRRKRRAKRKS